MLTKYFKKERYGKMRWECIQIISDKKILNHAIRAIQRLRNAGGSRQSSKNFK